MDNRFTRYLTVIPFPQHFLILKKQCDKERGIQPACFQQATSVKLTKKIIIILKILLTSPDILHSVLNKKVLLFFVQSASGNYV